MKSVRKGVQEAGARRGEQAFPLEEDITPGPAESQTEEIAGRLFGLIEISSGDPNLETVDCFFGGLGGLFVRKRCGFNPENPTWDVLLCNCFFNPSTILPRGFFLVSD
ncbi:hypothetical protein PHLCEN_2v11979 [Hermanssonia centrifuga]|uniref:Uncharacterized protein n=1 Tax=Hermanssonia centrifuga TaxID=98765 RepID=A0A2R6NIK0_9APHY|nr:hypothetical protein PHLCEN_2v11979 [Hermanssonia centrifuga]